MTSLPLELRVDDLVAKPLAIEISTVRLSNLHTFAQVPQPSAAYPATSNPFVRQQVLYGIQYGNSFRLLLLPKVLSCILVTLISTHFHAMQTTSLSCLPYSLSIVYTTKLLVQRILMSPYYSLVHIHVSRDNAS